MRWRLAAVPVIYKLRDCAEAGGRISYGASFPDAYRRLPVLEPNRFDLVTNLKTAMALGFTVPDKLLVTADEV